MSAPVPWTPKRPRTLWLDTATGAALDDDGRPVQAAPPGGAPASLASVLAAAELARANRVMLTGPMLPRTELLRQVRGWSAGALFLDHELPVGRYEHTSGNRVEVRRAAEWFGDGTYSPETARSADTALQAAYAAQVPGGVLFASPGATGLDAWLRSVPRTRETGELQVPPQVPEDVAEQLRATSPQHRIERIAPPAPGAVMPALWYLDGRWMYAALCNELGSGPAMRLTAEQATDQLRGTPYARARYLVRFTAPAGWDSPGVLMAKAGEDATDGWHTPLSGETWADAAEVHLAAQMGWKLDVREGLLLTKGRPLDTWAKRLQRARDGVNDLELGEQVAGMVRSGVRSILLHAIGAWHSSGRDETTFTAGPMQPPAGDVWGAPEQQGDVWVWRRRHALAGRAASMLHPEWSSQVWGRAHARILEGPTSAAGIKSGALYLRPGTLVGIYGDAVMTTYLPHWAREDDGKPGRLRVKGHLCGPVKWPTRAVERDELARAAEAAGPTCKGTCS
jgi:hypothetical protein